MGPDGRSEEGGMSSIVPLLAILGTRATHYLYSQIHPTVSRGLQCVKVLAQVLESSKDLRPSHLFRTTMLLILSLMALLLSFLGFSMDSSVARKVEEVRKISVKSRRGPYTERDIAELPEPVQRYLRYALQRGQPMLSHCRVKQKGHFRLRASPGMRADDGWKEVACTQHFSASEPGFAWIATIHIAPLIWLRGWESYVRGRGHMFWKLLSTLPLVNFGGPEIDRGGLSRYLAECVFFPTALLPSSSLSWQADGVDSARATLRHDGKSVSAVFHFNELGQVTHLHSMDRPRRLDDGSSRDDQWTGYYKDYRCNDGMNVPFTMEGEWSLISGKYKYAKLEIIENRSWAEPPAQKSVVR